MERRPGAPSGLLHERQSRPSGWTLAAKQPPPDYERICGTMIDWAAAMADDESREWMTGSRGPLGGFGDRAYSGHRLGVGRVVGELRFGKASPAWLQDPKPQAAAGNGPDASPPNPPTAPLATPAPPPPRVALTGEVKKNFEIPPPRVVND